MKWVLVTGGFGYVGSRLTPHLLENGYHVRVLDLNLYGDDGLTALKANPQFQSWESRFQFIRGDIRDPKTVAQAVEGMDAIIHLAAISNDPTGNIDEVLTRQVNFDAIGMLVSLARQAKVKRFINASSSSVFGIKDVENVNEKLEPEPITFYSKYKMLSECIVTSAASNDFCTVNIRPATICGFSERQRFDLTVNKLTVDAVRTGIITVHGGEQRRPNVGMTDIVNLYTQLLKTPAEKINGKTFNFGFENQKIIDIAKIIQAELSDLNVKIEVTSTKDNRDYHITSAKIVNELGYEPISSIRQEVRNLRAALANHFADANASKHYNMQSMNLKRNSNSYDFAAR